MTEAALQASIISALVLDGWLVIRSNSGALAEKGRYVPFARWQAQGHPESHAGMPDVIAVKDNYVLFIECKTAKGRLRSSQVTFRDACMDTGNLYVVARSLDDVAPYLEHIEV